MVLTRWSEGLAIAARELGINASEDNLAHLIRQGKDNDAVFRTMVDYLGLQCERCHLTISQLPAELFPLCVPLQNDQMVVDSRLMDWLMAYATLVTSHMHNVVDCMHA